MKEATLRLFNSILLTDNVNEVNLQKACLENGFYVEKVNENILPVLKKVYMKEDWNKSFYKSWEIIKNTSYETRLVDQILHYISTMVFVNTDFIYLPDGEISDLPKKTKLKVIHSLTKNELVDKIIDLLSGVALKQETIDDLFIIVSELGMKTAKNILSKSLNKEFNIKLSVFLMVAPKAPIEFLRTVIYLATDKTLLIKDKETIELIKMSDNKLIYEMFNDYVMSNMDGLKKLSTIFYRYKPLWLAFKKYDNIKPFINKMRKYAVKYHIPMKEDYINSITSKLKNGENIFKKEFNEELKKVNSFRKMRLLNALDNLKLETKIRLYKIRNGKSYIKMVDKVDNKILDKTDLIIQVVEESIINDLKKNVENKVVCLTEKFDLSLPTSEKQFISNVPVNSSVEIADKALVGIYWENQFDQRIDLDLSLTSVNKKYGWNGYWDTDEILFSGDITDAPNGASELYLINNINDGFYLLNLNFYNYNGIDKEVKYSVMVASSKEKDIKQNYVVNPNELILKNESTIGNKQKTIGLVKVENGKATFFFTEYRVNNSAVSVNSEFINLQIDYLKEILDSKRSLEYFLNSAGAIIVYSGKSDINLKIDSLDKNTIINLF